MILTATTGQNLWYAALREEYGLRLVLANPNDIKNIQVALYKIRQDLADPELASLSICLPNGGKEVWIVHKGHDLNEMPKKKENING